MAYKRRKMTVFLLIDLLCTLYCIFPFLGAVSMANVLVRFILYFIACTAACLLAYKSSRYLLPKIQCGRIETVLYNRLSDRTFFLALWGILAVGWIPAYLGFFPGIFGYDAPWQMVQILSGEYSSHHPLLHTMLLGAFMNCGKAVFGTYNGGVALFCIVQGLVVTSGIARSFLIMKRCGTPFPVFALSLAWCIWNPVLQVLTFNVTKDVLFGAAFLHFVLNCHRWLTGQGEKGVLQTFGLILSGVLMCLLRNQGIYIAGGLLLLCVFLCRRERRFLVSLCAAVVISQLFFSVSHHVFGVSKGDMREMLSVPMQQTALVCKLYMEGGTVTLTPEEFEKFTTLVPREQIPEYHLSTADPIKSYFNTAAFRQDIPGYLSLYLTVGVHNIGEYLTAFRCMAYPYWDASTMVARDISISNPFPELTGDWGIAQNSLLPAYKEYLSNYILYGMSKKIPVLSWFLQPGLCIWILTALFGLSVTEKNRPLLMTTLTGLLFFGTLLLGPVALLRYIYPLMLLTPWLLALLCRELSKPRPSDSL